MDDLADEFDEGKAKEGWGRAVRMLNEDYVFLWLAQGANYHVERDWVKGYYYNPMHSGGPNIGDYSAVSKG
jgi:ABC-type transport system substrate-binding protein